MRVINTIQLPNPHLADLISDDTTIKLIGAKPHLDLLTLDPESLGLVSRFPIDTIVHDIYSSCIDDDCIYLPTKFGQILAVDKFSGDILATLDLGMPIMSDLRIDDKNIYCICGVPISRKLDVSFENFCVCICDKYSGNKSIQTNYFKGVPAALEVDGSNEWVLAEKNLVKYTNGELSGQADLKAAFRYLVTTNEHVICISSKGIVKTLHKDNLDSYSQTEAVSCIGKPHLVDDALVWVTPTGICRADYHDSQFYEINVSEGMLPDSIISQQCLFGFSKDGTIISFNLADKSTRSIKLTTEILRKPAIAEDYLLVASATQLHQLKVS